MMFDWQQLNDYQFVKLTGELLARLGFVDVDYQGDGPDGGVDLFATELLPFAIQGRVPFRWAVQCKFSQSGPQRAVNDADVRDIEGILRSDRYRAHDPRGYMLVTNRRIAQNVIERLRGIDRQSHFRTARLDEAGFVAILGEHARLAERYFGGSGGFSHGLGRPRIIVPPVAGATSQQPPTVGVELSNPADESTQPVTTRGVLDTGAWITVIPEPLVSLLRLRPTKKVMVQTAGGKNQRVLMYHVRLRIERDEVLLRRVIAIDTEFVLIGRDVLNNFTVMLRPDGGIELH
jgi:predicted aspartyl protease